MERVTAVPADAEELVRLYRPLVVSFARKQGIPPQDAEDVAHEILAREIENDILGQYDPDFISPHNGKPVTFRAFLLQKAALRCRGHRDRLNRLADRNRLVCDRPVDDDGTRWIDVFGGAEWDDYSELDGREFLDRMRSWLATRPPVPGDSCDLLALFDEVCREVREEGKVTAREAARQLGISDATASAWLARLRQVVSGAGEMPKAGRHVVGGVTLTLADLRRALEILKADRTIMVRQPLARAGHPLAAASDKNWYHPFSKEERRLYPELEIDPQTHRRPAGHVKVAVIHRLERMLGILMAEEPAPADIVPPSVPAPDPEPDPEPTPLDLLEAELFRLGADGLRVDQIMDLARSAFAVAAS